MAHLFSSFNKTAFYGLIRSKTKKQQTIANKSLFRAVCYCSVFFPEAAFAHYIVWFAANISPIYCILFFLDYFSTSSLVRMRSPVQIRLAAPHSRKASLAAPRRNLRGVCVLPHAKNQRFFPRGPRLCLRLCPTKYPRFAAVLCGDPVVFPQKKNARRALTPRFSLCSKTIRRSLIFAPRGGRLTPPVLFLRTSGFCVVAP